MHPRLLKDWSRGLLLFLSLPAVSLATLDAQMVSPDIDSQPGPFSYYSKPVDELGAMYAPSGTQVTPEGYLYTGFGELMFFVGPEQTPVATRVRTLEDGYLPVLSYTVTHLGVEYRFTMFSWSPQGEPISESVVNFIRVTVTNQESVARTAFLTSALRYTGEQTTDSGTGDNRFARPTPATGIGQFHQPGEAFSKEWTYGTKGNAFLRGGRVMYLFPNEPSPRLSLTLRSHYNRVQPLSESVLKIEPTTPADAAAYSVPLTPHGSRSLDFVMPLIPPAQDTPEFSALETARFDAAHVDNVARWRKILAQGMSITVPERKVVDTFRASLVYNLLALNKVDGLYVQTVNQFQYHRFYLRDSADLVRMYDATGYSDIAAKVLSFYPLRQAPDGNFWSQPSQYDGWGEALWSMGEHYRRTHDQHFAEEVYPGVARAAAWLIKARAADPMHIMPQSDVRDNEYVAAHLTGYNFLALDGLKSAIELARATGHSEDAEVFQREYEDFHRQFFAILDRVCAQDGGYIPPALDAGAWKGSDWGNLLSVTPEPVLDPHDPRVTATLHSVQARYQEGITTYTEPDDGQFLHHYLTIKNTLSELVRGEQEQAIRELYAELLHTSSTHAGFEYAIRPWGSRDFEGNLSPHGWFAADYRNLLRNMMVREEGDSLHLLSAVSPEWIGTGKEIRVERAPTYFGPLSFTLETPDESTALLHIRPSFDRAPKKFILHLPWFMQVSSVTADGALLHTDTESVSLPINSQEIKITWRHRPGAGVESYEKTVRSYEAEYRKRYEHLLNTGEMSPAVDTWRVPK